MGTLLLVNYLVVNYIDIELLLKVSPKKFTAIGSADKWYISRTWSNLGRDNFQNVRSLIRSDMPLCMHLYLGKKFEQLLKGR